LAYDYITTTGIVVADTSTTLTEVQTEWTNTFGNDLDLTPSTPQGLMISAETLNRTNLANFAVQLVNQFNPNYAGGVFQDAMCSLFDVYRVSATYTLVTATLTGTSGTIIPSGSLASNTNGDNFQLLSTVTIPSGGTIDAIFQAVTIGAVKCLAGTLNTIQSGIVGWTGINNASDGTVGINEQTDSSLRLYRSNTLANQAVQTTDAVQSALYLVNGVKSLTFRENYTGATATIDGISLVKNSIWACIYGGANADIAKAMLSNRSAGCNFNGAQSVATTASSGQVINVLFDRPTIIPFLVRITVKISSNSSVSAVQIQDIIYNYANGLIDGEAGLTVGTNVSPFELGAYVASSAGVYVKLVEIAPVSTGTYQSTEYAIALNQIALIQSASAVQVILL